MKSIFLKLTLAFLSVTLVSILLIVFIVRQNTTREFRQYSKTSNETNLASLLEDYYDFYGSWKGIENLRITGVGSYIQQPIPEDRDPLTIADQNGVVIKAGTGFRLGEKIPNSDLKQGISIENDNEIVGYLLFTQGPFGENSAENNFLRNVNSMLIYGGIAAGIIAIALGILLSQSFSQPIREMTAATQAIAKGDLSKKVKVRSKDELGKLAESFNQMSGELERSRKARQQMTADIAHELRTPVSLILGHSEGVHDGVIKANRETMNIIRDEAIRLERLVEELRVITLADAGELVMERVPTNLINLLTDASKAYSHSIKRKAILFETSFDDNLPILKIDPGRIMQVIGNLLDNAIRYTPSHGVIKLTAVNEGKFISISVEDSGAGVPEGEMDRIFDRLYRADKSRQRQNGGSGLGLAIAKSFVELQGGKIWAEPGKEKGLKITFVLPIQ